MSKAQSPGLQAGGMHISHSSGRCLFKQCNSSKWRSASLNTSSYSVWDSGSCNLKQESWEVPLMFCWGSWSWTTNKQALLIPIKSSWNCLDKQELKYLIFWGHWSGKTFCSMMDFASLMSGKGRTTHVNFRQYKLKVACVILLNTKR